MAFLEPIAFKEFEVSHTLVHRNKRQLYTLIEIHQTTPYSKVN